MDTESIFMKDTWVDNRCVKDLPVVADELASYLNNENDEFEYNDKIIYVYRYSNKDIKPKLHVYASLSNTTGSNTNQFKFMKLQENLNLECRKILYCVYDDEHDKWMPIKKYSYTLLIPNAMGAVRYDKLWLSYFNRNEAMQMIKNYRLHYINSELDQVNKNITSYNKILEYINTINQEDK